MTDFVTCPACQGRGVVPLDDDYYAALEEHLRRTSAAIDAALKPQPEEPPAHPRKGDHNDHPK